MRSNNQRTTISGTRFANPDSSQTFINLNISNLNFGSKVLNESEKFQFETLLDGDQWCEIRGVNEANNLNWKAD